MNVRVWVSNGEASENRSFAAAEITHAASRLGLLTVEQFDVVVWCLQHEHVFRVYRVKILMEAHPAEHHDGVPMPVWDAILDLRAIEEFMQEAKIDRLPPETIHERMASLANEGVQA